MEHNSDRKAFEACIVEIVQCLAGLCDTEIGIHTILTRLHLYLIKKRAKF